MVYEFTIFIEYIYFAVKFNQFMRHIYIVNRIEMIFIWMFLTVMVEWDLRKIEGWLYANDLANRTKYKSVIASNWKISRFVYLAIGQCGTLWLWVNNCDVCSKDLWGEINKQSISTFQILFKVEISILSFKFKVIIKIIQIP